LYIDFLKENIDEKIKKKQNNPKINVCCPYIIYLFMSIINTTYIN